MSYMVVIGTNSIDEYYEMDCVPVMGEKVVCKNIATKIGGMLANAASVYAGYGNKTYMVDFVNTGKNGQAILQDMHAANVSTEFFTMDDTITDSICLIMLKDGERVIFVIGNNKYNLSLTEEQIGLIEKAGYVYTTLKEIRAFQDKMSLVKKIHASGAKLAIDVEPGTMLELADDWEIISKADILFINQGGAEKLAASYGEDYHIKLMENNCTLVFTKGKNGCRVQSPDGKCLDVSGYTVPVLDTTGAGDTFNASFLHAHSHGWDLKRCAEFANTAAAKSIGALGPRSGIALEKEVLEFAQKHS